MHCPACNGSLYKLTLHNVKVDACSLCQGIWFGDQTLKKAVDQMIAKESIRPSDIDVLFEPRAIAKLDEYNNIRMCPECSKAMDKFNYAYDSNIILDKCTGCGGIWTDKGKVKAIAEFAKLDPRVAEIGKNLIKSKGEGTRSELTEYGIELGLRFLAELLFCWL